MNLSNSTTLSPADLRLFLMPEDVIIQLCVNRIIENINMNFPGNSINRQYSMPLSENAS